MTKVQRLAYELMERTVPYRLKKCLNECGCDLEDAEPMIPQIIHNPDLHNSYNRVAKIMISRGDEDEIKPQVIKIIRISGPEKAISVLKNSMGEDRIDDEDDVHHIDVSDIVHLLRGARD